MRLENVRTLVQRAKPAATRIEIDMESTAYTDRTLKVVESTGGLNAGAFRAVIQAYLFHSEADVDRMNLLGIPVRLCKGAYHEAAQRGLRGQTRGGSQLSGS